MRSRFIRNQDGATLVIVLVFMTIFGLIAGGLLTETGASIRYTTSVSNYEKKVYAADAGVALGIQQLQQHNDICPEVGLPEDLETVEVNGFETEVTCQTTSGSTEGGLGYAIITRSLDESLSVRSDSGDPKEINGPVYVRGDLDGFPNPGMSLTNGNFRHGACTGKPNGLILEAGYRYICQPDIPVYDALDAPTLPSNALILSPLDNDDPDCKYFYPGKYTLAPTLDTTRTNYFASGVYYFELTDVWLVQGTNPANTVKVVGGKPAAYEGEPQYDIDDCASDADAIEKAGNNVPEVIGSGVQFIFGKSAWFDLGNFTQVELFTRTLDGESGTRTATFVAVPPTWSGDWVPSDLDQDDEYVLNFENGTFKKLVIHGLVYTPDQNVRLWATEDVDAAVLGGVIVWKLTVQSAGDNLINISAADGVPEPRHIVITAKAPPTADTDAGRQITSTAVVGIANDPDKTVTVHSWRTQGVTELL